MFFFIHGLGSLNYFCNIFSFSYKINFISTFQPRELEKIEEAKLKAKFPAAVLGRAGGPGGHTAFLQKRLAKGVRFWYKIRTLPCWDWETEKTNIFFSFQQKYFDSGDYQMAKQRPGGVGGPFKTTTVPKVPTGDTIPTPETVPIRKTSIIQPKFTTSSQTS